jgi:dihydroneopterin aldolase
MRYVIFLERLCLHARIGIHPEERAASQRLLIDVALLLDRTSEADDIGAVVDYDGVRTDAAALAAARHWDLQETFCAAVVRAARARGAAAVLAVTRKPDIYPDCAGVGCRMLWRGEGVSEAELGLLLQPA